ncbi:hypothetical protein FB451DRAFT_1247427, partial [Mycena latifolia]
PADNNALRARLTQIDAEMDQLRAKLDELAPLRKGVADALEAIIYPILTIPPEIATEIFMAYVATYAETGNAAGQMAAPRGQIGGPRGPFLIAHVCRAWRAIALNSPSLWSTLQIGGHGARSDSLLQYSLQCAGNRPLNLDLTALRDLHLAATVTPYLVQSQVLSLTLPSIVRTDGGQGCWPILKSLTVMGTHASAPTLTRFSGAPQLSELVLHDLPHPLPWLSLPWEQLTRLELAGQASTQVPPEITNHLEILRCTPNLESLSVVLINITTPRYAMPTPVRLARLRTLEFKSRYQRGESEVEETLVLLRHLILPALKHLITQISDASLPILRGCLARSACDLHSLSLDGARSSLSSLISTLEAVGTVRNVSIPGITWPATDLAVFFTHLALDPDGFLPRMHRLNLERCMPAIPHAALVTMLDIVRDTKCDLDKPADPPLAARLRALVNQLNRF